MFKDSLAFLPSSLDSLVKSTKYSNKKLNDHWEDNFKITKKNNDYIKSNNDLHLLTDKGIYPYDWVDDIEKFKIKQLTHRSEFYSTLIEKYISKEDYKKAKHVWKHFNIKKIWRIP